MGNQALQINNDQVNGAHADIAITTHGSDFYWAVCAVMTVATAVFIGLAGTKKRSDRIFHYITSGVTMVAAIAYFSMASNLGWTSIDVEFIRSDPVVSGLDREIFYVRYIDWFITTPLLLLDLMLTAAMPWPTTLWIILIDWVMVITGLVGALVSSSYKWGYFTFGCVALFWIVYVLVWEARIHANGISTDAGRAFLFCGSLTAFLWILYPIAWGLCEGGNVIAPDSEAVFYGILDMLAKPGFGALLLWGHRNISPAQLGLAIKDYGSDDHVVNEKHTNGHSTGIANGSNGVTNGTNGTTATNGHTTAEQAV
ncbi:hypothetical protein PRZ48_013420 [Zasmidium cellare]|uniref:Family A G protein-coupled receptor-like protein n=1 Tax=Zasmidium cellare TaxID=395010 RepID=A0ABR0E0Z5_ZASCE|nr:hypothetical protein PRZ48_013420 [Zasmidium cellare]